MPPELETIRNDLVTDTQKLPPLLQGTKSVARDLFDAIEKNLDAAVTTTNRVVTEAQGLQQADVLPIQFTGLVHNYRFGMVDGTPMHRFDVEVEGTGLWLACIFTSSEFDALLVTAKPSIDLFQPEVIDGRMVTVKRDPSLGRMVPLTFGAGADNDNPPIMKDKEGVDIRVGDLVSLKKGNNSYDRSFRATVVGYDPNSQKLTVQPTGGRGQRTLYVPYLVKFSRVKDKDVPKKKTRSAKPKRSQRRPIRF